MSAIVEHLKRMEKTLQEKAWTVGVLARNQAGQKVLPSDPTAHSFCYLGLAIATDCPREEPGSSVDGVCQVFESKYNPQKLLEVGKPSVYLETATINDRLIQSKQHLLQILQELIHDSSSNPTERQPQVHCGPEEPRSNGRPLGSEDF